jgi:hypothetical protein
MHSGALLLLLHFLLGTLDLLLVRLGLLRNDLDHLHILIQDHMMTPSP